MNWRGGQKAFYAQGRLKPGTMNKGEAAYAGHLELLKRAGDVLWYRFEGLKLRLADNTFYTPDFAVLAADSVLECHELKGFMMDDANVKIKVASEMYPFRFWLVKVRTKRDGGGWNMTLYGDHQSQDDAQPKLDLPFEVSHETERAPF